MLVLARFSALDIIVMNKEMIPANGFELVFFTKGGDFCNSRTNMMLGLYNFIIRLVSFGAFLLFKTYIKRTKLSP